MRRAKEGDATEEEERCGQCPGVKFGRPQIEVFDFVLRIFAQDMEQEVLLLGSTDVLAVVIHTRLIQLLKSPTP